MQCMLHQHCCVLWLAERLGLGPKADMTTVFKYLKGCQGTLVEEGEGLLFVLPEVRTITSGLKPLKIGKEIDLGSESQRIS